MIQVRIHGRGGQGVVTAAEIIAIAAFKDKKFSQAFPSFGVERTGAPIEAFAKIDKQYIKSRQQVYQPDILIILDASLIISTPILQGCSNKTKILVNTAKTSKEIAAELKKYQNFKTQAKQIFTLDATSIALKILGKNLANTVILGSLAKHTNLISLPGLKLAIKEKFASKAKTIITKNIEAVSHAYEEKN